MGVGKGFFFANPRVGGKKVGGKHQSEEKWGAMCSLGRHVVWTGVVCVGGVGGREE